MNVYDNANELAKAMRESHEFKKLKESTAALEKEPETKKLVDEFLKLSQDVQFARYQGQEPAQDTKEKLDKLNNVLSLNSVASEYLNSFTRFQLMLMDVTNSIQDVVKEAMGEK